MITENWFQESYYYSKTQSKTTILDVVLKRCSVKSSHKIQTVIISPENKMCGARIPGKTAMNIKIQYQNIYYHPYILSSI